MVLIGPCHDFNTNLNAQLYCIHGQVRQPFFLVGLIIVAMFCYSKGICKERHLVLVCLQYTVSICMLGLWKAVIMVLD